MFPLIENGPPWFNYILGFLFSENLHIREADCLSVRSSFVFSDFPFGVLLRFILGGILDDLPCAPDGE